MIKEIFDIEPIQKNSLIVFLFICCISFLQIFLFKKEIIESGSFLSVGLSIGLSICWIISSIPTHYAMVNNTFQRAKSEFTIKYIYENIILSFGFFLSFWLILFTYIAYEFDLTFKTLIRVWIIFKIIQFTFWIIFGVILDRKHFREKRND